MMTEVVFWPAEVGDVCNLRGDICTEDHSGARGIIRMGRVLVFGAQARRAIDFGWTPISSISGPTVWLERYEVDLEFARSPSVFQYGASMTCESRL